LVTTTITFLSSMLYTKLLYPNFSNLLLYVLVLVSLIFFFLFSTSSLLLGSSILRKWIHQSSFISLLMEGQDVKASSPSFSRFNIVVTILQKNVSRNPSLGFVTKVRACKVTSRKGNLGVTLHAPGSVGKCEGMNPHTSKGTSTLGVGISVAVRIFKEQLQGSKLNGLRSSLYYYKSS